MTPSLAGRARAPGKLMIAGEYSVLRPGGAALALAVDAPLIVTATPAAADRVTSEALGLRDAALVDDPRLSFVAEALRTARLLAPVGPLELHVGGSAGQVDGHGQKLGFGSSAAVTVATIAAALAGHGVALDRPGLFRLAALAHARAQGRAGSGYDVATQVWGGVVLYRPPAAHRWTPEGPLGAWLAEPWPEHTVEQLPWPEGLFLTACWLGQGASTRGMMATAAARGAEDAVTARLDAMAASTRGVIEAWRTRRVRAILAAIDAAEDALGAWDAVAGTGAVTPAVRAAVDAARSAGCAGRTSGAGGGDCVLAFASELKCLDAVRSAWRAVGLHPIEIAPDSTGATWISAPDTATGAGGEWRSESI